MNFVDYFSQLYDYNYWANRRMLEAAGELSEEQLHRQHSHSWGSVYETLLHIMNAEWLWLMRWKGSSISTFPTRDDYPTLLALEQRWTSLEEEMRDFVRQQSEVSLVREVDYKNTRGERFRLPLWQMMAHLPNHGTHHRGELGAMLAMMGVPHEEEDWLFYFLEASGQN